MNLTMPWNANKPANNGWSAPIDDVKQQIGQQVDNLVKVAAQVGHDVASQAGQASRDVAAQAAHLGQEAGSTAASTARDLGGQALKTTQGASSQALSVAREVPTGATSLAQQVIDGAANLGREIRAIRVTRQPAPAPKGPDVLPGIALLAGVGSGLALMYFFDPGEGRRRRALLRDQFRKWTRIGRETATGKAKDVRNRTVGVMYEAKKAVTSVTSDESAETEEFATEPRPYSSPTGGNGQATGYETTDQTTGRPVEQPIS
jgi:hypothetical protein